MVNLYLFIFAVFAINTQAAEVREATSSLLNRIVTEKPAALNIADYKDYSAEKDTNYKGRVDNRSKDRLNSRTTGSTNVSRNIILKTSKNSSQLENFEATAGELVQKLEDDRQRKLKKYSEVYDGNKTVLKEAYTTISKIKAENLGKEQDPAVQNAFKCYDLKACNEKPELAKSKADRHAIKECSRKERTRWNGREWECVGLFETLSALKSCSSSQYGAMVNGSRACIDYIYFWYVDKNGTCGSDGKGFSRVECRMKKSVNARTSVIANNENYCLGKKPKGNKLSCATTTYAKWVEGTWSSCMEVAGEQYGERILNYTCPKGKTCKGKQPVEYEQCDLNKPIYFWQMGSYGVCDSSGEKTAKAECRVKLTVNSLSQKAASESYCLEQKPADKVEQCYAEWVEGDWTSCREVRGEQYGERILNYTCPKGKICKGRKPVEYEQCDLINGGSDGYDDIYRDYDYEGGDDYGGYDDYERNDDSTGDSGEGGRD